MTPGISHWTERSLDDYQYKVATDFVLQLNKKMERSPKISQKRLAGLLSVSTGRVSQVFNDPGNLSLRSIIRYARGLGMKVAVVAYDDGDPSNEKGPINSEIFSVCWSQCGRPRDFFDLQEYTTATSVHEAWIDTNVFGSFQQERDKDWTITTVSSTVLHADKEAKTSAFSPQRNLYGRTGTVHIHT